MRKVLVLILFCATTSCLNQANCLITSTNYVKIDLKELASTSTTATITFNSISVLGTSLAFYSGQQATAVAIPVKPDATETTFIFNYQTLSDPTISKVDTITFSYNNEVRLISEDCGAFQYQTNLAIVKTDFIKTKLINTSLLTAVTSNLEIYF